MFKSNYIILALIFYILPSCDVSYLDKEVEVDAWNGNAKLPLGYINYTISELFDELGSNNFEATSTEELSFSFSESFTGNDDSDFDVKVPNTTITRKIDNPITLADIAPLTFPITFAALPDIHKTRTVESQVVHNLNMSQELTGASFNGGQIIMNFTSTFDPAMVLEIEIPTLTKKEDGATFAETLTINGTNSPGQQFTFDLDDYNANFTHNGSAFNLTHNRFLFDITATIAFEAGNTLRADDALEYDINISNASTNVVYGDFKQESFAFSDQSLSLDFFSNYGDSDVSFSNPTLTLTASNDYGFPVGIDLSSVKGIYKESSENLFFQGDQSLTNMLIVDGIENYGEEEKSTSRTLDANNSNIVTLLENKPSEIQLNVVGSTNPINKNPNENFYASPNKGLTVGLEIKFDDISLKKEIELNDLDLSDDVESAELIVSVENKIPLTGKVLLEFMDASNQNVVHTETLNVFNAAAINDTGESDGKIVSSNFRIELDKNEIENISKARYVSFALTLSLPNEENKVLLKGSDELSLNIGVNVDAEVSLN